MEKTKLYERLRDRATTLGKRALDEFLSDEQRLDAVDFATKSVGEGRRILEQQFERLFIALGLATQADLSHVSRKVVRLRKRLETLLEQVESDRAEHTKLVDRE